MTDTVSPDREASPRPAPPTGVTHVALRVPHLREAEAYYINLFDLGVAWREAETPDGWKSLPDGKTWDDALRAGVHLGLVMLHRPGFALALEETKITSSDGPLSHIGLLLSGQELERLRAGAADLGLQLVHDAPTTLVFDDRYGVRWEPTTTPYTHPERMSTGARTGGWLEV